MKTITLVFLLFLIAGCGYGMQYTKKVPAIPHEALRLRVNEIVDFRVTGRRGEIIGKGDFVRNLLINELIESKQVKVDQDSGYRLAVKIEDYRPGYRKYIALSAHIVDSSTNRTVWNASISGLSKKGIDEVTQNVIRELVRDMISQEK